MCMCINIISFSTLQSHFANMNSQLKCYCACFKQICSHTILTKNALLLQYALFYVVFDTFLHMAITDGNFDPKTELACRRYLSNMVTYNVKLQVHLGA